MANVIVQKARDALLGHIAHGTSRLYYSVHAMGCYVPRSSGTLEANLVLIAPSMVMLTIYVASLN